MRRIGWRHRKTQDRESSRGSASLRLDEPWQYLYFSDRQVNAIIENNSHHASRATTHESGLSKIAQIKASQSKTNPPAIEDSRFARGEKAKEILAPKIRSKLSCEGTCEYIDITVNGYFAPFLTTDDTNKFDHFLFGSLVDVTDQRLAALCLFGSAHNLLDRISNSGRSHTTGWYSSSTPGIIRLIDLARENKRIHAPHLDFDSRTTMLYDAVNIVLGQGQTHLTNSPLSPCARCYTIGEGLFNVLARIDIQAPEGTYLPRDIPSLTHAFIGPPLYIRYKERPRYYSGAPQVPATESPYMNWDILADTR